PSVLAPSTAWSWTPRLRRSTPAPPPPNARAALDERVSNRHRHRWHVHRRRAGRRRDRRHSRRQGAHDPGGPGAGIHDRARARPAECQATGRDVAAVVHATTVATNAIIEGKTARVGMLVTRGFRDILEIGRQIRSRLYDVHLQKPAPLVERRFSLEVSERLD